MRAEKMKKPALFSFTPSLMDGETLEAIFVQREALAADLVERIQESALTPAKLHTLLIGARGMGKTHLVSLVYHRLQAMPNLKDRLLIAWLREEEWGVTSFLDLLLRTLRALAENDSTIEAQMEALYDLTPETAEAAGARLLNECIGERTLLLIAENLDDLFSGLGETGQQHLRAFLQTYANCTVLATSPRLFNGVQRRTAPFYGFFRPVHLSELTTAEAQQLLINIAIMRQQTELVDFLQTPTGQTRIKAVQHLAGGNPRIYIIFADFLTHQSLEDLVSPFMNLVDVLTPYYQSRMQYLSPQQRKIVELLCEKKYALTVKTIAQRCFMTAQTASSQLKELREKGYVKAEAIGRESFYDIAEPLMRICLGVKKERGEPLHLMVDFLRVWYPKNELQTMQEALMFAPMQSVSIGRYLKEALNNEKMTDEDPRIQAYLDEIEANLDKEDYNSALKIAEKLLQARDSWVELERYASCLTYLGRYEEAMVNAESAIELNPNYHKAWNIRGVALWRLGQYEAAISSYDKAIGIKPNYHQAWNNRGVTLNILSRNEEAIISYNKALRIKQDYHEALSNRGNALSSCGRNEDAIVSCNKALAIKPDFYEAWFNLGNAWFNLECNEKAIASYDNALLFKTNSHLVWSNRGAALNKLGRTEEAIISYKKALEINPNSHVAWYNLGNALSNLGHAEEAIASYDKALLFKPDVWLAWWGKGLALVQLNRYKEAVAAYKKALEINPEFELLKYHNSIALAALNSWAESYKVLDVQLNDHQSINIEFLERAVQSLFTTILDPQQWQPKIFQLVNRLEGRSLLPELGVALVKTTSELTSEFVSIAKATAWRDAWAEVVGQKPEFDLPLRLLNTALHYKQTPQDPRVFLELPIEERKILPQALGSEHEEP